jgi:hypothetical protein
LCFRCCRKRFQLREKIASGANALGTHFSHLDVNGSGVLETSEFRKALEEMNLGLEIDDYVFDCLMKSGAGKTPKTLSLVRLDHAFASQTQHSCADDSVLLDAPFPFLNIYSRHRR